jgi:hypothetical protein
MALFLVMLRRLHLTEKIHEPTGAFSAGSWELGSGVVRLHGVVRWQHPFTAKPLQGKK